MRKEKQNQESIDAATAEVKKEGEKDSGFADNTDAVHSKSREDTGLLPCPFCGRIPEVIGDGMWFSVRCSGALCGDEPTCQIQPRTNGSLKPEYAIAEWNKRVASRSTLPQAPTDTRIKQENAPCLAAQSRKQDIGREISDFAKSHAGNWNLLADFANKRISEIGLAARVEPTTSLVKALQLARAFIGEYAAASGVRASTTAGLYKRIDAALNASCAVKEEKEESL